MSPDLITGLVLGAMAGAFGVALIPCKDKKLPKLDPSPLLESLEEAERILGIDQPPPAADMPRLEFYSKGGMILSRCVECKGVNNHAPECSDSGIYHELEADPDLIMRLD